jgi:DNA (cytosine-5)-methyltransferase 1
MTDLTVASLFDGIGGFCRAFERAGARVVATVEIDKAAAAVSARHFPHARQFDDVTKVSGNDLRAVGFVPERGIITAGFPCQDVSVAGRREGLAGARTGLWWDVVRLLDETRPRWFVGENVPGLLSSNDGRDFGAVLGSLAELGYGFASRILDAKYFGVPQRRRRVFIVGRLGTPFGAAAEVLFESESSAGNSAEGNETRSCTAELATCGSAGVGANDRVVAPLLSVYRGVPSTDQADQLVVSALTARGAKGVDSDANGIILQTAPETAATLTSGRSATPGVNPPGRRQEDDVKLVCITGSITHTLTAEGADASEDGTGRGTPIVAIQENQRGEFTTNAIAGALSTGGGKPGQGYPCISDGVIVRRLTPLEYERLQGYPDDWTEGQSDAARYRELGNSLAVPVMEWIARRLIAVDEAS